MLEIVEEIRLSGTQIAVMTFLKAVLDHPIPAPGSSILITIPGSSAEYKLSRPSANDYLLDYVSTKETSTFII